MATIINDRDIILQAASVRLEPVGSNYIYLTPASGIFKTTNTGVTPASYTITANTAGYLAGAVTFTVTSGTATLTNITDNACTLTPANMTTDSIVVTATMDYLGATYTAKSTITKINDVVVLGLSSDTLNIPTDEDGLNAVYTNANATISVSVGNNDDTSNWIFTKNVTSGTATVSGTGSSIVIDSLTTDSATITISANKSGYPTQTKTLSINKLKAAAAPLVISLISPVNVIASNQAGTTYSLPTGNNVRLYKGSAILASNVVYGPATTTKNGLTLAVNTSTGAITLTGDSWNTDSEEFSLTAVYNTVTYTTTYSITKAKSGSVGVSGRTVSLSTDVPGFTYKGDDTLLGPSATASIIATAYNTTGTLYYEFTVKNSATTQNTTSNTFTYTPTASYANMPDSVTVKVREQSSTGTIVAEDSIAIGGYKAGTNTINVELNNPSQSVTASNNGVVTSYSNTGTSIRVIEGITYLTQNGSLASNGTFRVTAVGTNITPSTPTGAGTTTVVFGAHTAMSESAAVSQVAYVIEVRSLDGTSQSFTKYQNFSKSIAGYTPQYGTDYVNGTNGPRGSVVLSYSSGADVSSAKSTNYAFGSNVYTQCQNAINSAYSLAADQVPRNGDRVILYGSGYSNTYLFSGNVWSYVTLYVDGSAVVNGTLAAEALVASGVSSNGTRIDSNGIKVYSGTTPRVIIGVLP